jgi:hypothetical protein
VAKLKDHAKTTKHSNVAKEKASQKSVKTLFSLPTSVNQTRKRRELRLALICSYNTSLQTVEDFSTFLNEEFGQGTVRLKRTKCHALITNVLAPYFRAELKVIDNSSILSKKVVEVIHLIILLKTFKSIFKILSDL